jgi:endonuclease/exonuclease/phosphatase family metal-dependent hydrolase
MPSRFQSTNNNDLSSVDQLRPVKAQQSSSAMADPALLTVVSYNVHQCVGLDRRRDPSRIAQVLNELNADIIGLQEVHSESGSSAELHQMSYLAAQTNRTAIGGPIVTKTTGEYGNVLLTRHRVVNIRLIDLSVPGREARGAIDADIDTGHAIIRVIVSHLGLRVRERMYQTKRLLGRIAKEGTSPIIVLLDFNEWFPFGFPILRFNEEFGKAPAMRTFPSAMPIFSLDRVWVKPRRALVSVGRYVTPLSRIASDHLPLHATVDTAHLS